MTSIDLEALFVRYRDRGDVSALSEVFDRTAPELLRLARQVSRDSASAEDLLQSTFLTAIEAAPRYEATRRLVPWLVGILVNEARNLRRREAREIDPARVAARHGSSASQAAEDRELRAAVADAYDELPASYRDVVGRKLWQGQPFPTWLLGVGTLGAVAFGVLLGSGGTPAASRGWVASGQVASTAPAAPTIALVDPVREHGVTTSRVPTTVGLTARLVAADGAPAASIRVDLLGASPFELAPDPLTWSGEAPDLLKATTVTDAAGRLRFDDLDGDAYFVLAIDPGGAGADLRVVDRSLRAGDNDLGDIAWTHGAQFVGRVVDEDGVPVPRAKVRTSWLPAMALEMGYADLAPGGAIAFEEESTWRIHRVPPSCDAILERLPTPTVHTDAAGAFVIDATAGLSSLIVEHPGRVTRVLGPFASSRDVGAVRLSRSAPLEGRVLRADGEPAAGRVVFAGTIPTLYPGAVLKPIAVTADNGTFTADGLAVTDQLLAVEQAGQFVSARATPGGAPVTMHLEAPWSCDVRVVDASGRPVSGVSVRTQPGRDGRQNPTLYPPRAMTHTRVGDVLRVDDLIGDSVHLLLDAPGHAPTWARARRDHRVPVTVELAAAQPAMLAVLDDRSGAALVGAHVVVTRPGIHAGFFLGPFAGVSARTDHAGRVALGPMSAGRHLVRVACPGYAPATLRVEVPGELAVVRLQPAGAVIGSVASSSAVRGGPDRYWVVARSASGAIPRFAATDARGRFSLSGLPKGPCRLSVLPGPRDAGLAEVYRLLTSTATPLAEQEVDVRPGEDSVAEFGSLTVLEGARWIEGTVLVDGARGAGFTVSGARGLDVATCAVDTTDSVGAFRLGPLPSGPVTVRVRERETLFAPMGRIYATVTVDADDPGPVHISVTTGTLCGRVVDAATGAGVPFAELRLRSAADGIPARGLGATSAYSTTAADGSFMIGGMASGAFVVKAAKDGYCEGRWSDVVVPAGAASEAALRLSRSERVQGRVLGEDVGRVAVLELSHESGEVAPIRVQIDAKTGGFEAAAAVGRNFFRVVGRPGADGVIEVGPGAGSLELWIGASSESR